MFWPCETRTSTCRNFATISSGLYRFLAITVLLDVKDIPQVGPLQWGWITSLQPSRSLRRPSAQTDLDHLPIKDHMRSLTLLPWPLMNVLQQVCTNLLVVLPTQASLQR